MQTTLTKGSKANPNDLPAVFDKVVSVPEIDRSTTYVVLTVPGDNPTMAQRELHCCLECQSHDAAYQVVVQDAMLAGVFDPNTMTMSLHIYGPCREARCVCGAQLHTISYETGQVSGGSVS